jgi:mannose-6-phosphate isomerase-like protein (cupin superfamily)
MFNKVLIASAFFGAAFAAAAAAQTAPPAVYKNGAELMAIIKGKIPTTPDQADAPVDNPGPYRINVVRRGKPGTAMAHTTGPAKGTEVHYIIDGAATVVTGGTIVRPTDAPAGRGGASATIQGGETHHLTKGDVLVIPAGTPHWYKDVEGSVTYLEVRFDVSKSDNK